MQRRWRHYSEAIWWRALMCLAKPRGCARNSCASDFIGRDCAHEFAIGFTPCWIVRTSWSCHNAAICLAAGGMSFLKKLRLSQAEDQRLLDEELALIELLSSQIKAQEACIKTANSGDADTAFIASMPGMGPILSAVVAAEIDGIERFDSAAKLCAYAGLIPSTYASGGVVYNGRLLRAANKWLGWALIEAAWVAIGCSGYFGSLYRHHRARGKKANTSITIVARRMITILGHLLKDRRNFKEDFPLSPVAPVAH